MARNTVHRVEFENTTTGEKARRKAIDDAKREAELPRIGGVSESQQEAMAEADEALRLSTGIGKKGWLAVPKEKWDKLDQLEKERRAKITQDAMETGASFAANVPAGFTPIKTSGPIASHARALPPINVLRNMTLQNFVRDANLGYMNNPSFYVLRAGERSPTAVGYSREALLAQNTGGVSLYANPEYLFGRSATVRSVISPTDAYTATSRVGMLGTPPPNLGLTEQQIAAQAYRDAYAEIMERGYALSLPSYAPRPEIAELWKRHGIDARNLGKINYDEPAVQRIDRVLRSSKAGRAALDEIRSAATGRARRSTMRGNAQLDEHPFASEDFYALNSSEKAATVRKHVADKLYKDHLRRLRPFTQEELEDIMSRGAEKYTDEYIEFLTNTDGAYRIPWVQKSRETGKYWPHNWGADYVKALIEDYKSGLDRAHLFGGDARWGLPRNYGGLLSDQDFHNLVYPGETGHYMHLRYALTGDARTAPELKVYNDFHVTPESTTAVGVDYRLGKDGFDLVRDLTDPHIPVYTVHHEKPAMKTVLSGDPAHPVHSFVPYGPPVDRFGTPVPENAIDAKRLGERLGTSVEQLLRIASPVQRDAKGGDTPRNVRAAEGGGDTPGSPGAPVPKGPAPAPGGPRIVINPQVFRDKRDALCVAFNEAFRVVMEMNGFEPAFEPTEAQRKFFADTAYADDELQLRRTILARIATLDTSVKDPTDEQLEETAEMLEMVMEVGAPQNEWEQSAVKRLHDVVVKSLESTRANGSGAPAPKERGPTEADGTAEPAPVP